MLCETFQINGGLVNGIGQIVSKDFQVYEEILSVHSLKNWICRVSTFEFSTFDKE